MAQLHKLRDPARWSLAEVVRDWQKGGYFRPLRWVDAHKRQPPHFAKWWPAPPKLDRVRMPTVSPEEAAPDAGQAKWDRNAAYFDVQAKNYSKNTTRKSMLYEHAYAEMRRRGYNDADANRLAQLQVFQSRATEQNPLAGVRLQQDKWFRERPVFQFIVETARNKKRHLRRLQAALGDTDVELVEHTPKHAGMPFDLSQLQREAAILEDVERNELAQQEALLDKVYESKKVGDLNKYKRALAAQKSLRATQSRRRIEFGSRELRGIIDAKARVQVYLLLTFPPAATSLAIVQAKAEVLRQRRGAKHLRPEFDDLLPHESPLDAVDEEAETLAIRRGRNALLTRLQNHAFAKDSMWHKAIEDEKMKRSTKNITSRASSKNAQKTNKPKKANKTTDDIFQDFMF
ncbi:MAG: hypothetical protein MHM6MM_002689 [Cercozoa sp. M6MM]